jgi:RNA polymerase sigma-70 factor (ECF subfamily)
VPPCLQCQDWQSQFLKLDRAERLISATEPFEAIVSEHYERLYRFALSLTRAEADAQDLTQQAFYVWATKGHRLRDGSKVKTWLFTTLHRAFLDARRRQNRFPQCELDEAWQHLPTVSLELNHLDSSQVLSALAKVDDVFQAAVTLFYLEDYSYKDIAEVLEVPIGTVKSRLARGLAQLREILSVDGSTSERCYAERDLSAAHVQEPIGDF